MELYHLVYPLALLSVVLIFHSAKGALARLDRRFTNLIHALLYTCLALTVMSMPIMLVPGARLDTRGAFIALASLFTGPVGFFISVGATVLYRILLGGAWMWTGNLCNVLNGVAGLCTGWHLRRRHESPKFRHLLFLAVIYAVQSVFSWLLIDIAMPNYFLRNLLEIALLRSAIILVFGIFEIREVQLQKRERSLNESHRFFEAIQNIGQVGVWMASPQDGHIELSTQVYRILKRCPQTQSVASIQTMSQVIHTHDQTAMNLQMTSLFIGSHPSEPIQIRLIRPDGSLRTVWSHVIALEPSDDRFDRKSVKVGLFHDVTDHNSLFDQLAQSAKLATLGELSSMISHEINSPLTSAIFLTEKMRALLESRNFGLGRYDSTRPILRTSAEHPPFAAGQRPPFAVEHPPQFALGLQPNARPLIEINSRLMTQLQNITTLVKSINAFARAETTARMAPIEPHNAIFEAVKIFSDFPKSYDVQIEIDIQAGSRAVYAHGSRLQQVIINLLSNARDAVPTVGGKIKIVYSVEQDRRVVISVRDNGAGIPSEIRERLFDPFFTTKPKGQGTGLGLSIVERIVREMRGELRVASEAGRGARFDIVLSIAEAPIGTAEVATRTPSGPGISPCLADHQETFLN